MANPSGGPGWYDDPYSSDPRAERYWDGSTWTPRRRPKKAVRPPGPQYAPQAPGYQPPTPHPYQVNMPNPAQPQPLPPAPGGPALFSQVGRDLRKTIGILIALAGAAITGLAFLPWGQARVAGFDGDVSLSARATFPGVGRPSARMTISDDAGGAVITADAPAINSSNPGWIALVAGLALLACGIAYSRNLYRTQVAIIAAVVSAVAVIFCVMALSDPRAAFGDPPAVVAAEFSRGPGLVAASVLACAATALSIAAYITEWKTLNKSVS
jgi:hypothetical protein